MIKMKDKKKAREKRHYRVRKNISGTAERPRLNVFRSLNHIYAQLNILKYPKVHIPLFVKSNNFLFH